MTLFILVIGLNYVQAQLDTSKKIILSRPVFQKQQQFQTIPSAKAALIRSDAVKLQTEMKRFRDSIAVTKAELEILIKELDSKLDNMNEMGEMESLRLQMAMDRLSKMMTTLSNLMKKMSETSQNIIQNLK